MHIRSYIAHLNWYLVLVTLLVFAGLCKLGFWQLARAVEKEQRLSRIESYHDKQHFSLKQVLTMTAVNEDINDLPIKVNGEFEQNILFLLDNQVHQGQVGYRVLQVLNIDTSAVLVNLGWIAAESYRENLPQVSPLTGIHTITGHIRIVEKGIVLADENLQQQSWPKRIQAIDLNKISQNIGQKLLPFVVYLDKKEDIGFAKNWQPIVMPPEKHRGYAFQWFSLAVAWLVLMFSASIYWARQNNNKDKGEYV
ncbi:SURF1 family protein [Thalassotalea ganghwensis]